MAAKKASLKKAVSVRKKPAGLRSRIERLDRELLRLANERAALALEALEAAPVDSDRAPPVGVDDQEIARLLEGNRGPLPEPCVRTLFRELLGAARAIKKVERVAYLGPEYSFSHLAAVERFGRCGAEFVPVGSIAAVFEEVNRGRVTHGLVPLENSTDGRVADTLDMFTRLPLKICGEVRLRVRHNLLSRSSRAEINEVYSRPQALSQCREWLSKSLPHARQIEVTSTSTAAQLARDKPGAAAIASREAADKYGLDIIAESIEDNKYNVTRFAVIGEDMPRRTGNDKTAVLFQIPHKPGTLADALMVFKRNRVNLTWIESFPLRGPEHGYLFFIDFEGHLDDARVKRTIAGVERKATRIEVLGSFPRSEPVE